MTTEINVFLKDSPICSITEAKFRRLCEIFSYDTIKQVAELLDNNEVLGAGVDVNSKNKSVKVYIQLG